MKLAGIDYSITGPAIAIYNTKDDFKFENVTYFYMTKQKSQTQQRFPNVYGTLFGDFQTDEERFNDISDWAMECLDDCDHIAMEGYAMGAKGKVFNLAENCGLLKHKLWANQYDFQIYAPSEIKKFATGKGNANKEAMYQAFLNDEEIDLHSTMIPNKKKVDGPVTDMVDAHYIVKLLKERLAS